MPEWVASAATQVPALAVLAFIVVRWLRHMKEMLEAYTSLTERQMDAAGGGYSSGVGRGPGHQFDRRDRRLFATRRSFHRTLPPGRVAPSSEGGTL